mmetsp:Transcript_1844/g.1633  ORF Transcript_1844/g.1633 Transcript_1844/m.1633 type:complete len:111 (-) Transcript_1844:39-371(-)
MFPTETDLEELIKPKVDPENKGDFGLDEFTNMLYTTYIPKDTPDILMKALQELDWERNGKIKMEDAEEVYRVMGEPFDQDQFLEFVAIGDPDNTGYIDIKTITKEVFGRL